MFRSNSSICLRFSLSLDIINEEDYFVEEIDYPNFNKGNIPKIDVKAQKYFGKLKILLQMFLFYFGPSLVFKFLV